MPRGKYLEPKAGDILAFRLTHADEELLIPWFKEQRIPAGEWSNFIRQVLLEKVQRQRNPFGPMDPADVKAAILNIVRSALDGTEVSLVLAQGPAGPQASEDGGNPLLDAISDAVDQLYIEDDD